MMEKIFGLDIDGVIRNICDTSLDLYNIAFYDNMKFEDWKEYNVDLQFPKIQKEAGVSAATWFFDWHGRELFRESDPIGNVSDTVERLRDFGKVVIISYQKTRSNKIDTLEWLDAHGVNYDGICFVNDKSLIRVDYLIDDNPHYLANSDCSHAILIDAPYNRDAVFTGPLKRTYDRFGSLEDFVKHFEKENAKEKN